MSAVARGQATNSDLRTALEVVGARWTLLIIEVLLHSGPCRFKDLTDNLEGISTNLLSERLRELENAGLIVRAVTDPPGSVVTYSLTPIGERLSDVIDALATWARQLDARPTPSRAR